jgi:cysteine desulfurase/selenocysteine lyase
MDWNALREQFPVTRKWAFLDHAGVSAASAPSANKMAECARDLNENGATRIGFWSDQAEQVRRSIAKFINADPAGIALVPNTTTAIGLVAEGFPWQSGDNVVLHTDEYPANVYPWMNLADRGVEIRWVKPRDNRIELNDIRDAVNLRTRIVAISWVGFGSGFCSDLAALSDLCDSRDVYLLVDVIQGLGALPLDVQAMGIDFAGGGCHKWLLSFQGAGFFYIRPSLLDLIHPVLVGAFSVDPVDFDHIDFKFRKDATRWQGGTLNLAGIAAWGASIDLLAGIGHAAIAQRIQYLTNYLCERVNRSGLALFSDRLHGSGIVSFTTGDRDPLALKIRCKEAGVIVNCRAGRLRVSPHCYNSEEDLARFREAVK